nr:MAG TPA: hypothetical protein [Caudoviricetes sp.]
MPITSTPHFKDITSESSAFCSNLIVRQKSLISARSLMNCYILLYRTDYIFIPFGRLLFRLA